MHTFDDTTAAVLFAVLLGTCCVAAVLGAWHAAAATLNGERRRLRVRLSRGVDRGNFADRVRLVGEEQAAGLLEELLGRAPALIELRRTLAQAAPDLTVSRFLAYCCVSAVGGLLAIFTVTGSVVVAAVAAGVGAYVPFLVVVHKRNKRQKVLVEQLPDSLDFLGRALRAGHSLPVGLQMMGSDLPQPLAGEFQRAHNAVSLGASVDDTFKAMTERVDSTDFAFFVTAVLVQRQTGGDLAKVLDNITGMLRQRIQLQSQVKAKTAEGRFTGYILAAFPMVMFVVTYTLAPEMAGLLVNTTIGNFMLGSAVLLSVVGLLFIRKITTVKV